MARHRQKDEEAGAEGYGILNTRKVLPRHTPYPVKMLIYFCAAHVERPRWQDSHKEAYFAQRRPTTPTPSTTTAATSRSATTPRISALHTSTRKRAHFATCFEQLRYSVLGRPRFWAGNQLPYRNSRSKRSISIRVVLADRSALLVGRPFPTSTGAVPRHRVRRCSLRRHLQSGYGELV